MEKSKKFSFIDQIILISDQTSFLTRRYTGYIMLFSCSPERESLTTPGRWKVVYHKNGLINPGMMFVEKCPLLFRWNVRGRQNEEFNSEGKPANVKIWLKCLKN